MLHDPLYQYHDPSSNSLVPPTTKSDQTQTDSLKPSKNDDDLIDKYNKLKTRYDNLHLQAMMSDKYFKIETEKDENYISHKAADTKHDNEINKRLFALSK